MVFTSVGIKCPECAGTPVGAKKATTRVRTATFRGTDYIVTRSLIGICIAVYILQVAAAGDIRGTTGDVFREAALFGPLVADGEWWRLITSGFLHAGPIHLFFNMLMLWWFGRPLEQLIGGGRFLSVYAVSLLAGAAGALLITPTSASVGASGAVFGILGAGLVLERNRIPVFGGAALVVIAFNLAFSFVLNNVSVGGHIGGLIGGMGAMLVLSRFGRGHAVHGRIGATELVGLLALAVVSVAVSYARVRGLA
jgi:membrane associated rhomboid family serine protease